MKPVWKVLLALALVLPMGVFVVGSLMASAADQPDPRAPIVIQQGTAPRTPAPVLVDPAPTPAAPAPSPTSSPTSSPVPVPVPVPDSTPEPQQDESRGSGTTRAPERGGDRDDVEVVPPRPDVVRGGDGSRGGAGDDADDDGDDDDDEEDEGDDD